MKKSFAAAVVFFILAACVYYIDDASSVQKAAIGGQVTWVIPPGTPVEEGSELLRVSALSGGEAVAARANVRGVVDKVMMNVGDHVKTGMSVAKIERK